MEEMEKFWKQWVEMWDEYRRETFTLCLVRKKGKTSYVVCLNGTIFVYLKGSQKTVYMGHKRWLLKTHKYRKMADSFDVKIVKDSFAPQPATGRTVFEMCQKVKFKFGKKSKGDVDDNSKKGRKEAETTENIDLPFKKMSIFFKYFPYWEDLTVRHAIDGMHLQKECV
jgi:hypothetical protein